MWEKVHEEFTELKAEIERLTEENDILSKVIGSSKRKTRIYELQKQVDELTAFKNEAISMGLYGIGRKDGEEVAVKSTAKEICKAIHEDLQADLFDLKHSIFDTERQKAQEQQNIGILSAQDTVSRFEKKIKEHYGVEVE